MERGLINDVPIWVKTVDTTNKERTVIKEAPAVDGAVVEVQGQTPEKIRLEFELISDGEWITADYATATFELKAAFLIGGPFTITAPVIGEVTGLWLADPVTIRWFDETRLNIAGGTVTFVDANPFPVLQDNAASDVKTAVSALSKASAEDFGSRVPSDGFFDGLIAVLEKIGEWLTNTQALINTGLEPVNSVSSAINAINNNLQSLLRAPQNFASQLAGTSYQLLSLVPSLHQQGSTTRGSAAVQDAANDLPSVLFVEALLTGAGFDADVAPTQGEILGDNASAEDMAEDDQVAAGVSISLVAVTAGCALAITATKFATVNSVLNVADAIEPAFQRLFNLDNLDYRVYSQAVALRASTLAYLSSQAASLPTLRNFTAVHDTNLFDLLPAIYPDLASEAQVQLAVDTIWNLNTIPKPQQIVRGTTLRYIDPLA